jgi:predicted Zn-dependent peptidase
MQRRLRLASWIVLACLPGVAAAALDLRQATMDRLDNGLELIVLEEHSLPVVSVQMLYRTGARDEEYGRTGLAHYLEHMAFRATENFPATQVNDPHLRRRRRVARLHVDRPDDLFRDAAERTSSTSRCASKPTD